MLAANSIVVENLLPGNPASEWDIVGNGDPTLQGFATDISVDQGETIEFKIDNQTLASYRLDIYRIGYYDGNGARLVDTISSTETLAMVQPTPLVNTATGMIDAGNWTVTADWNVPADATSGVYIARAVREDTNGASHIIFVVRDDDGESDILFQTADTTWQAYNRWGGNSLYVGPFSGRAYAVSYNRPFDTRGVTAKDWFFSSEYATVRFLEKNGYDVSYFTGVDSDRYGSEILEHDIFLSVGHDEYWSLDQRNNVETARDAGVNLAFFSGNEVYWKTRWESSIDASGTPYRSMVSYKETWAAAKIDPEPNVWTGTWRDDRFSPPADGGNPENALTGQIFTVNRGPGGDTGTPFLVGDEFSDLRFWRDTRIAELLPGETATVGDFVLGYEWDEDLDNGFRPSGLVRMSSTTQTVPEKIDQYGSRTTTVGIATHSLTQYRAASGALVFGAGTINWGWGLDGTHDVKVSIPDNAIQQATVNLFADMGVQPETLQLGLVYATMSLDVNAPVSIITSSGSTVVGGVPVTITGTASDIGGVVGGVEVSVDGGLTWRRADGTQSWSYNWTPSIVGPTTVLSRAADDSGNLEFSTSSEVYTVQLAPTSTSGLVAEYGFNEGSGTVLNDSSGNANHGVISGANFVSGFAGQGLSFDGIDDIVTIADSNSLDLLTGLTLEAWVRPNDLDSWTTVLFKESANGLAYGLYASDDSSNPPSGYIRINNFEELLLGTSPLQISTWNHLAIRYDSQAFHLFVNGVQVGERIISGTMTNSAHPLQIGGNTVFPNEFFNGTIDEVRIYDRPLSDSEIYYNMSTPVGGIAESVAPAASFNSPLPGEIVSGDITIDVLASDNVAVGKVTLFLDGQLLSVDTTFPFQTFLNTRTLPNGTYTLSGTVIDVIGNDSVIGSQTFQISNSPDTSLPSVNLLTPDAGLLISGSTVLAAHASDDLGVAGVQFQINGNNVGAEDLEAPYRLVWDSTTVADGDYLVTAISRDAAGNTASTSNLITVDNTPVSIVSSTPADGSIGVSVMAEISVSFSELVRSSNIAFELRDSGSQLIPATVQYDEGLLQLTLLPDQDLLLGESYTVTLNQVQDLAGNILTDTTWTFVTSDDVVDASIWSDLLVPSVASANDSGAVELGLRFQTVQDGYITGLEFYKGAANTGTHIGNLWTNTGTLLGSVTFTSETASGWQIANFNTPIPIVANTPYIVSYFAPNGGYAVDAAYFTSGYASGPFTVLPDGVGNENGLYIYGASGGFPVNSVNSSNYWVDPIFSTTVVDITAPSVTSTTPVDTATDVATSTQPKVFFSEDVQVSTITLEIRDGSNNLVSSTFTYDNNTQSATLIPDSSLGLLETFTVTVSGATDAAGNVMQSYSWSFTTASSVDSQPPTIISRSPGESAINVPSSSDVLATFDESIELSTLTIGLTHSGGQNVAGVLSYDSQTFTATFDPTDDLLLSTVYTVTVAAEDLAGNPVSSSWTFTTESEVSELTIWNSSVVPSVTSANDTSSVELGVKFNSSTDGFITALRFYKGIQNTGIHTGNLWNSSGVLLASATFTSETSSGWQQVSFGSPIPITANVTYVASYFAPNGGYSFDTSYFLASGFANGVLTALGEGVDGGNGVYRYSAGSQFPSLSHKSANYWVDVVFSTTATDIEAPTVVSQSPESNATNVPTDGKVEATFSESVQSSSISFLLEDDNSNQITATVNYNNATGTVTLTPDVELNNDSVYTVTLSGAMDQAGNTMSAVSWSFTTAPFVYGNSIWTLQTTPSVASANDSSAVELGVKFQASIDGDIESLRFYKGALNTGTHVGSIWDVNGTLLGSATFTNETGTGWQQVNFVSPISILANTTYIASYYAPDGGYAFDTGYFDGGNYANGPLTALGQGIDGGNGVYRYGVGGGFPDASYKASNYWIDVVFVESSTQNKGRSSGNSFDDIPIGQGDYQALLDHIGLNQRYTFTHNDADDSVQVHDRIKANSVIDALDSVFANIGHVQRQSDNFDSRRSDHVKLRDLTIGDVKFDEFDLTKEDTFDSLADKKNKEHSIQTWRSR